MHSVLVLIILAGSISNVIGQNSFQVGFWNIENLFDTTDALDIRDDDFTPSGKYLWTEKRLVKKFQDLSKVIHHIDQDQDLALLGLAEIENYSVLQRLNQTYLQGAFEIIHKESPDERGIDCGLLFDSGKLNLIQAHFIPIFLAGDEKTRDIIEAIFTFSGSKQKSQLHVFINHWPSRWGGQAKTDPLRRSVAATLRNRIDEILTIDPHTDIIIMGDFNDHPNDPSLLQVLRAGSQGSSTYFPGDLINTTWNLHLDPDHGTYMYRGNWGVLDQVIISSGMEDEHGFKWTNQSTTPFSPKYLLEPGGKYAGWPFRMYRSGKYQGGYSDHLPILCRISYSDNRAK
ncbi:MAG: hypothetical protein U9Q77_08675 [Candidatus Marinimicrobia bacterium]|nr:hypothetical protein [Candidatus Neomarinimicrobiota bacterium]